MKTSEFRKYLEEKGCNFKEDKNCFDILNLGLVFKNSNSIDVCITYCQNDLFENIYKYARTPLKEREEKKYYLLFPDGFSIRPGTNNNWMLGKDTQGRYDEVSISTPHVQKTFTQEEINAMPFDINFFIKVEV